jgi:hypothetical protein
MVVPADGRSSAAGHVRTRIADDMPDQRQKGTFRVRWSKSSSGEAAQRIGTGCTRMTSTSSRSSPGLIWSPAHIAMVARRLKA